MRGQTDFEFFVPFESVAMLIVSSTRRIVWSGMPMLREKFTVVVVVTCSCSCLSSWFYLPEQFRFTPVLCRSCDRLSFAIMTSFSSTPRIPDPLKLISRHFHFQSFLNGAKIVQPNCATHSRLTHPSQHVSMPASIIIISLQIRVLQ